MTKKGETKTSKFQVLSTRSITPCPQLHAEVRLGQVWCLGVNWRRSGVGLVLAGDRVTAGISAQGRKERSTSFCDWCIAICRRAWKQQAQVSGGMVGDWAAVQVTPRPGPPCLPTFAHAA